MKNLIKRLFCKIGWHSHPNFIYDDIGEVNIHARCKWCNYSGMLDSQGNLF